MAYEDFNPLDLSAYTKQAAATRVEQKKNKDAKSAKAVVKRVRIGPLLHTRFSKLFVFLAFLFIFAYGSYYITQWWLLNH